MREKHTVASLTANEQMMAQLQALEFTPNPGKAGVTSNLLYQVSDPAGRAAQGTVSLAVSASAAPTGGPVAASASITAPENTTVPIGLAAPTDPSDPGTAFSIAVVALPADGTVELADGTAVAVGQALTGQSAYR